MSQKDKVFQTIKTILIEILALEDDPEIVVPSASFFGDLGGESIELIELGFHIKKKLGVDANLQDISGLENLETDSQGRVTMDGLESMKNSLPHLGYEKLGEYSELRKPKELVSDLLTVEAIVHLVLDTMAVSK